MVFIAIEQKSKFALVNSTKIKRHCGYSQKGLCDKHS